MRGLYVEIQQERQLLQSGVPQQLRFVADEDGMLLLAFVEVYGGLGDLADQIAAIVRRLQVQLQRQLAEQIQGRTRSPV